MSGPEILAAQVHTDVLREFGTDRQLTMDERLDLAMGISLDCVDFYDRRMWERLDDSQQELLAIAAALRSLLTGIEHAHIDEGMRCAIGRVFLEEGGRLVDSQWDLADAAGDVDAAAELRSDRRAEIAGEL